MVILHNGVLRIPKTYTANLYKDEQSSRIILRSGVLRIAKTYTANLYAEPVIPEDGILLQDIVVTPGDAQVIYPDPRFDGIGTVTVEPVTLQEVVVYPSNVEQTIYPDARFNGIGKVTIMPTTYDYIYWES